MQKIFFLKRSPEYNKVRLLKDVDLTRRDYAVKFRVLRLWRQPVYNNPNEVYSIEMIVVDEEVLFFIVYLF